MDPRFFEQPILNSPYEYPSRHWELDASGQPTNTILRERRKVAFISAIPTVKKRRGGQREMVFDETAQALGSEAQQYDLTALIGGVRQRVDRWRELPDPGSWQVTPETARLLRHWRSHRFGDIRPFFCQVEAVETAIWLTEVAPRLGREGRRFLDQIEAASEEADADWEEWQIPREASEDWPAEAVETHRLWWEARIARQQEIDASIAARADYEYLYDKPYEDNRKVRVAGPFTVESLSPHRVLGVDENDELIDRAAERRADYGPQQDFGAMILEQLATAGVQQAHKADRISFAAVAPWPGEYICAEGRYRDGDGDACPEKRAGIFIGPEFGTVARPDLVAAAREAGDAGFDVLVACAFNYEAHASEFNRLGRIPVLKARMNADLHMAGELKNTGKGNLFVVFGEPDIDILPVGGEGAGSTRIQVKINGVDVFHPTTGEVRSDGADGIACWFIDTDYNEESFFVRHAYFLGANDPYQPVAKVGEPAWLRRDRPRTLRHDGNGQATGSATGVAAVGDDGGFADECRASVL